MLISIIVPCYNEEDVIRQTHKRLLQMLALVDWDSEFIYINDGSQDATFSILREIHHDDDRIKVVSFSRNFGHQASVSAGLRYASGDAAVIIDADLQDPPELIPQMVQMWAAGEGLIIYGKRINRLGESFFKKFTANVFYRLLNRLSDIPIPLDTGDFRLVDRKVIDSFNTLPERNKYIRGLFPWLGYKSIPLEYEREARFAGETKYSLFRMLNLAGDGLLSFSRKPLQIATAVGLLNIVIALFLTCYVLVSFFSKSIEAVPGWASTLLVILFFSGVQLLSLGILGTYIGRIFEEIKGRPEFVVEEIL